MKQHAKTKAYMGTLRFRRSPIPSNQTQIVLGKVNRRTVEPNPLRDARKTYARASFRVRDPEVPRYRHPNKRAATMAVDGKVGVSSRICVASGGVADEFIDTAGRAQSTFNTQSAPGMVCLRD